MLNPRDLNLPHLYQRLRANHPDLVDLVSANLHLDDERVIILGNALAENTHVLHLSIVNHNFTLPGAQALTAGLRRNKKLETLSISTGMTGEMVIWLGEMLQHNKTLRGFSLTDTIVSDEAAAVLARAIEQNRSITYLNLSRNQMSPEACRMIAIAVGKNSRLRSLVLDGNTLGDAGALAVAQTLQSNRSLRSLSLESTQLSDENAVAVVEALYINTSLRELNLSKNLLGNQAGDRLATLFSSKANLEQINLWENPIDAMIPQIGQAVQNNHVLRNYDGRVTGAEAIHEYTKRNRAANTKILRALMLGYLSERGIPLTILNKDALFVLFQEISYHEMTREAFDRLYSSIKFNNAVLHPHPAPARVELVDANSVELDAVAPAQQGHQDLDALLHKAKAIAEDLKKRRWNGRKKAKLILDVIAAVEAGSKDLPPAETTDTILNTIRSKEGKTLSDALSWHRFFPARPHSPKTRCLREFEQFKMSVRSR